MAHSETVYITGPIFWAKVFETNRDTGEYAPEGGQYTVTIGVNDKTAKVIKSWNRLYEGKEYEEYPDLQFFTFKRKHEARRKDGELIAEWSGPPKVVDEDGEKWGNDLIGNGSVGTIKLDVSRVKAKGRLLTFVRLEALRVDEHVPYEGQEELDEKEKIKVPEADKSLTEGMPF